MKKLTLTVAIVLGLGLTSFADPNNGGLFQRGANTGNNEATSSWNRDNGMPMLPSHGQETNQPAPLGTGIAVLTALGAAYLVGKRRNEE